MALVCDLCSEVKGTEIDEKNEADIREIFKINCKVSAICPACKEQLVNFAQFYDRVKTNLERLRVDTEEGKLLLTQKLEINIKTEDEVDLPDFYPENSDSDGYDNENAPSPAVSLLPYKERIERTEFVGVSKKQEPTKACDVCGKVMKVSSLRAHRSKHTKEEITCKKDVLAACDICGKVMKASSLRTHKYKHSKAEASGGDQAASGEDPAVTTVEEEREACDICGKFMKPNSLRTHKYKHKQEGMMAGVKVESQTEIEPMTVEVEMQSCDICGKMVRAKSFWWHQYRHKNPRRKMKSQPQVGPKDYTCDLCQKTFVVFANLKLHILNIHLNTRNFICNICGVQLKAKDTLRKHILYIHEMKEKEKCEHCGRFVKDLKQHINDSHDPKISLVCDLCGRNFVNKKSLWHHVKMAHREGRNQHKCNVCEKGFRSKIRLKEHMQIHIGGSYLYTCDFCTYQSNYKRNMRTHVKKQHPKEWLVQRQEYLSNNFDLTMLPQHSLNPASTFPNLEDMKMQGVIEHGYGDVTGMKPGGGGVEQN